MTYQHIFFDLDHTLWDFEKNSKVALQELFTEHQLSALLGCDFNEFYTVYHHINKEFWEQYRLHKVTREQLRNGRFIGTLQHFNYNDEALAFHISENYIKLSPYKKELFDGALRILDYLSRKGYLLHIITNGFNEVQYVKLTESKLLPYFKTITTSEHAGFNKPDEKIFLHALEKAGAKKAESIMIGDNIEADIEGAIKFGIKAIWFNPTNESNGSQFQFKTITHLLELEAIF